MEGFDVDDDFGDLYADVEVQASSAINGVTNLAPFRYGVSDCTERNENPSSDRETEQKDKVDEAVSDSEDDLNIVLNDKDCKSKSFGVLSDEDYLDNDDNDGFVAINDVKTRELSSPRDLNANLSVSKRQTVHGQCKGPVFGQISLVGPTRNFGTSQRRFGFTLPWNRSILDVNIDTFEEKLWRYPGIDITDFFNFGFDEDTWKQYCNSVDQYRFTGSVPLGNTNHVYGSQRDYEYGSKYGKQLEETVLDEAHQPKGRAIQVEDGESERQPTVDIRCQRYRDSDVVIQINLEDTSDISEKPDRRGRGSTCEASDNGNLGNEFSLGSMKETDERVSRSSEKTASSSNPMTDDDLDEVGKNSHRVGDENCHKSSFSSDETHELIEPRKKSVKKSNNGSNVCSVSDVETESPFEEEEKVDQLSLTSSLFESVSEDPRDSSDLDSRTITSPLSLSSEVLKGKNSKINPVDSRDFSRCKSPVRDSPRQWVSSVRWKDKDRNIGHSEEFDYSNGCVGRELTQNRFDRERDSYLRKNWKLRGHIREDESFSRHSYNCEEMDSRSNRNNISYKLQFRKSVNRGTRLLDRNRRDADFGRERFGRVTCDRSYERSRFEGSGRKRYENLYPLEDEYFENHQLHRDSDRFKDEYSENMDIRYLSSNCYRELGEDSRVFDRDAMRRLSSCASHDDSFSESFRFKRKRGCFRRSEVLPRMEKDVTFRPRSENFDVFENQRHNRVYSTFESLDMKSDQLGYKVIRDESRNRGSVYRSGKNCRGKQWQAFVRSRDSGDLGAKKVKESIRCHKDRISRLDKVGDSKMTRFAGQSKNEDLDIEEGQIISNCDNHQRILESMAKMEKRRERFKEPITRLFKKEEVKCSNSEIVVPFTVQHRPARKRQWRVG